MAKQVKHNSSNFNVHAHIIDTTTKQLQHEYGVLDAEYQTLQRDGSRDSLMRCERIAARKCVIVNHINALKRHRTVVAGDLKTRQRSPYGAVPPAPSILRG